MKPVMSFRPILWALFLLIVGMFIAALVVAPAYGQEAESTPIVIPDDPTPNTEINNYYDDVPGSVDPGQVVLDTGTIISGIIAIFAAGGIVGAAGLLVAVRAIRSNDPMKLAIERLYMSAPVTTQRPIRVGVELGKETFDLLDEVTDGKMPVGGLPPKPAVDPGRDWAK